MPSAPPQPPPPQSAVPEQESPQAMQAYFRDIAPKYDLITNAFSFGMDQRWKRQGVVGARLPAGAVILDLACGTGDFSRLSRLHYPGCVTVQADLTVEMLQHARPHGLERLVCGDAQQLPFASGSFDAVMVGYGFRNFPDLAAALAEIHRVLKPQGVLVGLDFYLPANAVYRPLYLGYLWGQGAIWGLLLHGRPRTYTYIPDSLRRFLSIAGMTAKLQFAGFATVESRSFLGGGIALHWARKAPGTLHEDSR